MVQLRVMMISCLICFLAGVLLGCKDDPPTGEFSIPPDQQVDPVKIDDLSGTLTGNVPESTDPNLERDLLISFGYGFGFLMESLADTIDDSEGNFYDLVDEIEILGESIADDVPPPDNMEYVEFDQDSSTVVGDASIDPIDLYGINITTWQAAASGGFTPGTGEIPVPTGGNAAVTGEMEFTASDLEDGYIDEFSGETEYYWSHAQIASASARAKVSMSATASNIAVDETAETTSESIEGDVTYSLTATASLGMVLSFDPSLEPDLNLYSGKYVVDLEVSQKNVSVNIPAVISDAEALYDQYYGALDTCEEECFDCEEACEETHCECADQTCGPNEDECCWYDCPYSGQPGYNGYQTCLDGCYDSSTYWSCWEYNETHCAEYELTDDEEIQFFNDMISLFINRFGSNIHATLTVYDADDTVVGTFTYQTPSAFITTVSMMVEYIWSLW